MAQGQGTRRTGSWRTRLALLAALLLPFASPVLGAAQDAPPPIVPIVGEEALAVVEGESAPIEPVAAPGDDWVEPSPGEGEWIDPATVDPAIDPALAPAEPVVAAPVETAAEVAVPLEQVPAVEPLLAPSGMGVAAPVDWAPPTAVYVAETGQAVSGVFLDVWRAWASELSWGYPITPEFEEKGRTVQYFGFGRFEWTPDDPNGEVVQFGDLGNAMRPFMVRRNQTAESAAVASAAAAADAWIPFDRAPEADSETVRFVPETGHTLRDEILAFWVQTGEASYLGNPVSEPYAANGLTYQMFDRGTVVQEPGGWPYVLPIGELLATRYGLDRTPAAQGELPTYSEALWTPPTPEPAVAAPDRRMDVDPNGERRVLVSLSQQYLWAYQGDAVVWQGFVSTGKAGFETPAGSFRVLNKLKSQTMEGVLGGEYYNVPDVPNVMYFTDRGHALHGTYWHNNFGTQMSHGCINLPMDVAEWMYGWAPMGMRVDIEP